MCAACQGLPVRAWMCLMSVLFLTRKSEAKLMHLCCNPAPPRPWPAWSAVQARSVKPCYNPRNPIYIAVQARLPESNSTTAQDMDARFSSTVTMPKLDTHLSLASITRESGTQINNSVGRAESSCSCTMYVSLVTFLLRATARHGFQFKQPPTQTVSLRHKQPAAPCQGNHVKP